MTPRSVADALHCSSDLAMFVSVKEAQCSGVTELRGGGGGVREEESEHTENGKSALVFSRGPLLF